MKAKIRRIMALVMSLMIASGCIFTWGVSAADESSASSGKASSPSVEATTEYVDDGHMNLDIVFALDASGSMRYSDPSGIALDAVNLFLDLCDDSCGIGYAVYTHKIKETGEVTKTSNTKKISALRKKIKSIEYDPYGHTDIALGLTRAEKILKDNKNKDVNRKKAIVLLSDGNTDLPSYARSLSESKKEMEKTLSSLSKEGIPVYAIGLNSNGSLDKKEVQNIAKKTNGKTYDARSSDQLTEIATDIFSDIYNIKGKSLSIRKGKVSINIKNDSIFYVNIIIRTKLTRKEMSPVLTNPKGKKVSLDKNDDVTVTTAGSYTMIKLIYPEAGNWTLTLKKATNDNCSIKQLDFYSVYIKQTIPETVGTGRTVRITATLNDPKGVVKDDKLLKTISMKSTVKSTGADENVDLTKNADGTYTGEFVPRTPGDYKIITKADSDKFKKQSTTFTLHVVDGYGDMSEGEDGNDDPTKAGGLMDIIVRIVIITLVVVVVVVVIVFIVVAIRARSLGENAKKNEPEPEPAPKPEQPKPKSKPIELAKTGPDPGDPDYVDVTLVEHDAIENLIKKGSDDAFSSMRAEDFQADESLEKLIRKGSDDAFDQKYEDFQSDPSLEGIIKTGGDGLEGVGKAEETYDDEYDDDEYDDDDYDDDDYEE